MWSTVAIALALSGLPAADGPPRPRGTEAAQRQPRFGAEATPPSAPVPCTGKGCRTRIFSRPTDCAPHRRTRTRRTFRCQGEERLEVTFTGDGRIASKRTLTSTGPRNPYPGELVQQWRWCPFRREPRLARSPHITPYQDPDVGHCSLLRLEVHDPAPRKARLKSLAKLHPYLADCMARIMSAAWARGERFRVISTIRRPKRKRGKWRGGGWHGFGLAVDVNYGSHRGLKSATRAYLRGGDRGAWTRLGDAGEACGLKWIGRRDPDEIFHFEWHPGWPGRLRGELFQRLARLQHARGVPAVWPLLRYDRSRDTAYKHLDDRRRRLKKLKKKKKHKKRRAKKRKWKKWKKKKKKRKKRKRKRRRGRKR